MITPFLKLNVLVACEFSGVVRNAFAEHGHYVMSCDLLPTEADFVGDSHHYQGNVEDLLNDSRLHWDLMVAHPTCTYLCNSGVRWLFEKPPVYACSVMQNITYKNKLRWIEMERAAAFFNRLKNANIDKICIENPIPHKYARALIGDYTQIIHPWEHGHGETKSTCLWLKNLPKLQPTNIVTGRDHKVHKMSPSKDRWKKRSVTFTGIGKAMAEQWS